jgi:hypothetical protein
MEQAANAMNRDWAERGKGYNFRVEISTFTYEEEAATVARFSTMLMAGQGYDLFTLYESIRIFPSHPPVWNWGNSGLLADIWQLIDNFPATERSDFYTNVLEAFGEFGGVWALPVNFSFEYVGVNTSLPPSIIERFSRYETIRVSELMNLYLDLLNEYGDEFGHMDINAGPVNSPANVLIHTVGNFICTDNRVSNLDSEEFTEFLRLMGRIYSDIEYSYHWGIPSSWEYEWHHAIFNQYAFTVYSGSWAAAYVLLPIDYDRWYTSHHIPLADENGNLRVNPTGWINNGWATLVYPALGNELLAWEFTQHLIEAFVHPSVRSRTHPAARGAYVNWGRRAVTTPILRRYFEPQMTQSLEHAVEREASLLQWGFNRPLQEHLFTREEREPEIQNAIARLTAYNEKPVSIPPFFPAGVRYALVETLDQFLRGLITAENAAGQMHNRVQLWLIE